MNKIVVFLLFATAGSYGQILGCTDSLAKNFNVSATLNDGSCVYTTTTIKPQFISQLSDSIVETSGLISYRNLLWTHNDDTDTTIYGLNFEGLIQKKIVLQKVKNTDWEEISQDSTHIYVGDFGNNYRGNRTNLHILRIEKQSFLANRPIVDTISFTYSDQVDFGTKKGNTTDFDCEAFVVTRDSIYLFTKQWTQKKTSIYVLPKSPGNYIAAFKNTLNVDGLVTGATYIEDKKRIALCGYSRLGKSFLYLLFDFQNNDFLSGNKRRINLDLNFYQIEGLTTSDGELFYLSNEAYVKKPLINNKQQLHSIDLSSFLTPHH
jgi:hypothetical protein